MNNLNPLLEIDHSSKAAFSLATSGSYPLRKSLEKTGKPNQFRDDLAKEIIAQRRENSLRKSMLSGPKEQAPSRLHYHSIETGSSGGAIEPNYVRGQGLNLLNRHIVKKAMVNAAEKHPELNERIPEGISDWYKKHSGDVPQNVRDSYVQFGPWDREIPLDRFMSNWK